VALAFALGVGGCAELSAELGYTSPRDRPSAEGGATLDLRANSGGAVAFGVNAHSTLGSDLQTIVLSPELRVGVMSEALSLHLRGGLRVVQFERLRGDWSISSLSPYGGPVLGIGLGANLRLLVSATAEYDVRLEDNEADVLYLGLAAGLAFDL